MKVNVKAVAKYNGHTIGNNGNITLKLKCGYDEITNYVQLIQMLNNDVTIEVKYPEQKKFSLGIFRVGQIAIDHDGEGALTFKSTNDFVEVDNLNKLITQNKDEMFQAFFMADVELEDDAEAGEENTDDEDWGDEDADEEEDWD